MMLQAKNIFVELGTRLTMDSKTSYEDGGEGRDHLDSKVGKRINRIFVALKISKVLLLMNVSCTGADFIHCSDLFAKMTVL